VHGNVWQWLRGFHQRQYPLGQPGPGGIVTDPEITTGEFHSMRGGSFRTGALSVRAAYRNFGDLRGAGPEGRMDNIGLRVMRTPKQ
jgi:formylglycine-generating enzyme required for sulfatase activity